MDAEQENPQPDAEAPSAENDGPPQAAEPENDTPSPKPARRMGIPAWTLGLLVLALTAVLVWAGNALIQSRQQLPGPTALPATSAAAAPTSTPAPPRTAAPTATSFSTPPPTEATKTDETQILIADLSADLAKRFHETLVARIEESDLGESPIRVELFGAAVEDVDAARAAGETQNATYVLWGRDTGQGPKTYVTRVGTQTRTHTTQQGHNLALSAPTQHDLQALLESESSVDAAADYVLFVLAYDQLDRDAAAPLLDKVINGADEIADPALDAEVHLYQGNMYAADASSSVDADYDAALGAFGAALEAAPDYALAYANRGIVRHAQDDHETALEDLNRALELDPSLANAYYARANVYRVLDQTEKTLADLNQALELDPQHARAYAGRALIRHNAGDHQAALEDYTRALELDPGAAEVYLNRGGTYATLGQLEAALKDYTRALELNPNDADAYYNRGTVYALLAIYEQALADLDRALELRPSFAQIYGNRGLVYKAMGDTEKAIADLEHFLELNDNPQWQQTIEQQLAELKGE